jgi:hypothetical protein
LSLFVIFFCPACWVIFWRNWGVIGGVVVYLAIDLVWIGVRFGVWLLEYESILNEVNWDAGVNWDENCGRLNKGLIECGRLGS